MALGLGAYNPMPLTLGGGESTVEISHQSLLDVMSPGWDTSSNTEFYAETYADAIAVTMIWAVNERLRSQAIPERMLENLVVWEEACNMRPTPAQRDIERRTRLSAKLRGIANNALGDIEDAAQKILGANFIGLVTVPAADQIVYWPGINPGPPGLEWSSNRARIGISMNLNGLALDQFNDLRAAVVEQLDAMLPSWMSFVVGVSSSFVAGIGIVGQTLL